MFSFLGFLGLLFFGGVGIWLLAAAIGLID